jgi:hypothetical protein
MKVCVSTPGKDFMPHDGRLQLTKKPERYFNIRRVLFSPRRLLSFSTEAKWLPWSKKSVRDLELFSVELWMKGTGRMGVRWSVKTNRGFLFLFRQNFLRIRKRLLTARLNYVPEFYFPDSKSPPTLNRRGILCSMQSKIYLNTFPSRVTCDTYNIFPPQYTGTHI